jgi:hypothetical protein
MSTREAEFKRISRGRIMEQTIAFAMMIVGVALIGYIAGYESGFNAGRADFEDQILANGAFVAGEYEYQVRRVQP